MRHNVVKITSKLT